MSIESGAVILVDSSGIEIAVEGGVATPASQRGYHALGSDGTNSRFLLVDTSGRPVITGAETPGSAPAAKPVLVAGSDGTNVRLFKTTTGGVVHAAVSDGTDFAGISTVGADKALKVDVIQSVGGGGTVNQGTGAAANAPWSVRVSDGTSFINPALEHVTAGSPHAVRLTDGTSFYNAPAAAQLPAALVGGRLDSNIGAWLGSTAPTVGSKTSANSIPVVIASDQGAVPVTDNGGSLTVDGTVTANQGTAAAATAPWSNRLSDGTAFYKTNTDTQLPASLVGGRLDTNNGAWLGSTAPTVGQKTMANSLPVAIASDQGALSVTPGGNVAHDASDSGNPVKIGFRAATALPTAVAANDRADGFSDIFGRQLTSHIDAAMQTWKSFNATTTQTGVSVWTPTTGKRIAITSIIIGSYGTTGARLILWFGDSADSTYTAGTDQLVTAASFAPSANSKPGLVLTPMVPIFCTTADRQLKITTDAGMSVDVTVYGYEW